MDIETLFHPRSVAVVGASSSPEKVGHEVMSNLERFDGRVYPVNPSGEGTLFGEPFVESIAAIDEPVDLAILAVPAAAVPDVVEDCAAAGVRAVVIYAGGFAESGPEGARRQRRIAETAAENDLAVLGPNTSGFVVPGDGLLASFASGIEELGPGDVAVIAQSGGVAHALAFQTLQRGRGLSAMVGLGNRATVGFPEAIRYFDAHADTEAIVLHVEGTDRGRDLLEACRETDVPVLAYKVGESDVGDFAESHTGALTGDHDLYVAGFEQYGVPTVSSTTELLDAASALAGGPVPDGPNVGVVTAQAGPGIIVADRIQRAGGRLPDLSDETAARLADLLSGITYADNPVDTGRPMPAFGDVVATVAGDDAVDAVLVYELYEAAIGLPVDRMASLVDEIDKPILFATDGPTGDVADDAAALESLGIPVVRTPERAADLAGALARYGRLRARRRDDAGEEVIARD